MARCDEIVIRDFGSPRFAGVVLEPPGRSSPTKMFDLVRIAYAVRNLNVVWGWPNLTPPCGFLMADGKSRQQTSLMIRNGSS